MYNFTDFEILTYVSAVGTNQSFFVTLEFLKCPCMDSCKKITAFISKEHISPLHYEMRAKILSSLCVSLEFTKNFMPL